MPDDQPKVDLTAGQGEQPPAAGEKTSETGADGKPVTPEPGKGEDAEKGGEAGAKGTEEPPKKEETPPKPKEETSQLGDVGKDEGEEPPVRSGLTPKDFIIQRKDKKIEKLKGKVEKSEETDEDEEEEGEVDPEDKKMITKVVSPIIAPLFEKTIQADDDREIGIFLKANPDFAPFEAKARRYMAHPSRRQLPVETVFFEVAGKHLLKLGADRQREADVKAKATQTGGGSERGGEGGKGVWDLTPEEMEAKKEKVRRGQP